MVSEYFDILEDNFKIKDSTALVLGVFDGVHKAHTGLIKDAVLYAKKHSLKSVVFTFDINPKANDGFITDNLLKEKYIEKLCPDYLLFQKINDKFMNLSPEEFVKLLKNNLNVSAVFTGENFTFGKNKSGNVKTLEELGEKYGFSVFPKEIMMHKNEIISSTLIRKLIKCGDVIKISDYLGRDYEITGIVEEGNHLGKKLKFPTANIYPDEKMLLPKYGVYKTTVLIGLNEYKAITNIGVKPTVLADKPSVETYILDFDETLYGKEITVTFKEFIRSEKKFQSLDELKKQISKDIEKVNED